MLHTPRQIPPRLHSLFLVGVILVFGGGLLASAVGYRNRLWRFEDDAIPFEGWLRCPDQYRARLNQKHALASILQVDTLRIQALHKRLLNPATPDFAQTLADSTAAAKRHTAHELRYRALSVQQLPEFFLPFMAGLAVLVASAALAAKLVSRHGLGLCRTNEPMWQWKVPYAVFATLIFVVHTLREVFTSVLPTTKSWYGWASFCVSSEAWTLMLLPTLGFALVFAYPATMLWTLARSDNTPELDVSAVDGKWGVGDYVLFLQTWSILSLVFVAIPTSVWLRALLDNPRLSGIYLVTNAAVFTIVLVLSGRLVRNAIRIRRAYQAQVRALGATWQAIEDLKPPPDPTRDFLGEHWWQLPAVIFGILAASWLVVERFGVSGFLLTLAGLK